MNVLLANAKPGGWVGGIGLVVLALGLLIVLGKVPLSYNLRNLRVRWITTILTAMAFTLVISLLTVMLAFVNGMVRLTEESGQPGNVLVFSQGALDELFSRIDSAKTSDIGFVPGVVRDAQGRPMCSRETYLIVTQPLPKVPDQPQRRRFVQVRGIDDAPLSGAVHGLELVSGEWFSEAGVKSITRPAEATNSGPADNEAVIEAVIEAVLGEGIAAQLGTNGPLRPGELFQLAERTWVCTGVMKTSHTTFGSEIWAKRPLIERLFRKDRCTSIVLRAADDVAAERLVVTLRDDYYKTPLRPISEKAHYENLSQTNKQFTFAIMVVTVFIAIGGVFGVMNTMFAAISHRMQDIGVMRILGFARWQILVSFLLESLVIAIVGGALGCLLGSLCHGVSATSVVSAGPGGGKSVTLELLVTADTIVRGMVLAVAMGLLGGLLPAISAMRLRPLESLR